MIRIEDWNIKMRKRNREEESYNVRNKGIKQREWTEANTSNSTSVLPKITGEAVKDVFAYTVLGQKLLMIMNW